MAASSRGAALLPLLLLAALVLMLLESCSSLPEAESMPVGLMFETGNSPASSMLVSGGGASARNRSCDGSCVYCYSVVNQCSEFLQHAIIRLVSRRIPCP
eukprot:7542244-Pyramimonas_sp.AAC.1